MAYIISKTDNEFFSLNDLSYLTDKTDRFINIGHVIINQDNPKQREPVILKDVEHLVGIKESHEARSKGEKVDHLYVISYLSKSTGQIKQFKFEFSSYKLSEIQQFFELVEKYLEKNKKLELFNEYMASNPIASPQDVWDRVEASWQVMVAQKLVGVK